MELIFPVLFLIVLIAYSYWVLKIASWKISIGLYVFLILDVVIIFALNATRPFVFGDKDANNLIIYGLYLMSSGALFTIPVIAFKDEVFKGEMPALVKQTLIVYLSYSALLLTFIILEALNIRSG